MYDRGLGLSAGGTFPPCRLPSIMCVPLGPSRPENGIDSADTDVFRLFFYAAAFSGGVGRAGVPRRPRRRCGSPRARLPGRAGALQGRTRGGTAGAGNDTNERRMRKRLRHLSGGRFGSFSPPFPDPSGDDGHPLRSRDRRHHRGQVASLSHGEASHKLLRHDSTPGAFWIIKKGHGYQSY